MHVAELKERVAVEIVEKKEWQTIALRKEGQHSLGWQPPKPKEKDPESAVVLPRILHRPQAEARRQSARWQQNDEDVQGEHVGSTAPPIVAGANLKYRKVVEQAGEIVNNTR